MADPSQDARKDEELRELNRRFEDILKRCEVQPKEDGDSFPDWYRPPEQGVAIDAATAAARSPRIRGGQLRVAIPRWL
eukprot:symbB.v1.2.009484.t1/scaffold602.1/size182573/8